MIGQPWVELTKFFTDLDTKTLPTIQAADFEKDDDSNFHIDWMTASSNMRAWNYSIEACDRNKAKQIAGRIIPALATTTALVTGLVGLEFYKLMLGKQWVEKSVFRNCNINLAQPPASNVFEPDAPIFKQPRVVVTFSHPEQTLKLDFNGDLTMAQYEEICKGAELKKEANISIKDPSVELVISVASKCITDVTDQARIIDYIGSSYPDGTIPDGSLSLIGHKPYPHFKNSGTTFSSWDHLTVNQGNLSVGEFVSVFKKNFWGLDCKELFAFKRKPVSGSGFLFNTVSPYAGQVRQMESMLAKATNDGQRRIFGIQLKQKQKLEDDWQAKNRKGEEPLIDKYKSQYGDGVDGGLPPGRNYIKLEGTFIDSDGYVADIPIIKYTFQ